MAVATATSGPSSTVPATTTVLEPGTVEGRGIGVRSTTLAGPNNKSSSLADADSSATAVSAEIQAFLKGEAPFGFATEVRAWFTVWTFLTRLPGPSWVDHHPGFLMLGMAYFPFMGALIGIFVASFYDAAATSLPLPLSVASAIATASGLWLTGCFHEDGLADASDGIGGGWSRPEILRIMTDTRLGTYGCAVLFLYVTTKLELLAALGASRWSGFLNVPCSGAGPALIASHTLARLTAPFLIRTREYVEEAGPKQQYYIFMVQAKHLVSWPRVALAVVTAGTVATLLYGISNASVLLTAVGLVAHASGEYGTSVLGGVMGDYLGATVCVTELVVLAMILLLQQQQQQQSTAERFASISSDSAAGPVFMTLWERWDRTNAAFFGNDDGVQAAVRWLLVVLGTMLWCQAMGRKSTVAAFESTKDEPAGTEEGTRSSSADCDTEVSKMNGDGDGNEDDSPRGQAERVCRSPQSTFEERYKAAQLYMDALAKPVGSLGTLEDWAARLVALQRTTRPRVDRVGCLVFAADHGVARSVEEGGEACSAYPQSVTRAVVTALERQVAAASVLARSCDADLRVIDLGVCGNGEGDGVGAVVHVSEAKLPQGTRNFCQEAAMTADECEGCLRAGRLALAECVKEGRAQAVALGEVGIGNTTASSALLAALTGEEVECLCDGGAHASHTKDEAAVARKAAIVRKALELHGGSSSVPLQQRPAMALLAQFGGAEMAGLVGAVLEASDSGIPVLVDGFIVTVAVLVAATVSPHACRVLLFCSRSSERGQVVALARIRRIASEASVSLQAGPPAFDLGLRLGEGTAALLAVSLLKAAAAMLNEMATIDDILLS